MTANQIAYHSMKEQMRSNKAKEAETYRHNTSTEGQARDELAEKHRAATANEMFNIASLEEKSRDNRVKNAIATAANTEAHRANTKKEQIQIANLHELIRDNKAVLAERENINKLKFELDKLKLAYADNHFKQEQALKKYIAQTNVDLAIADLVTDLAGTTTKGAQNFASMADLLSGIS